MLNAINYQSGLNKVIGFILAYSFVLSPVSGATSNDIANGVAAYNKGWYSTALYYLTLAEVQYPHNALIPYYRANTFVHLMKVPEAMTDYAKAVELDPNGEIGNYARQALQAACNSNNDIGADQQTLLQQGNALSNSFMQSAQARKSYWLNLGEQQYNHIRQTEQIGLQRMQNTGINICGEWIDSYTPDDIAAYKQREVQKEDHALEIAQYDARAISSLASQRANAIKRSATALAQQLADQQVGGDARLNPAGTNLYVRNYILTP